MKAILKNYRQAPRKVRLVGNLIKGKRVSDALVELEFLRIMVQTLNYWL